MLPVPELPASLSDSRTPHARRRLRQSARLASLCAALATAASPPLALGLLPAMAPLLFTTNAHAAMLGDANVRSSLGQMLDAEIEVTALTAAEADALLVRIASPEAYAAAGVELSPLVRSLRLAIEKRGQRTFIRVNSEQSVGDPFVILLVELNAGGSRIVRQYALLIDPPPTGDAARSAGAELKAIEPELAPQSATSPATSPATSSAPPSATPPTSPSPSVTGAAAAAAMPVAPAARRVRTGDTLAKIAAENKPADVRLEQALVAWQNANPQAFVGNNINRMKSGSVLAAPAAEAMRAVDPNEARRIVIAQSANFQRYREALAERMNMPAPAAAGSAGTAEAGKRSSGGKVGVRVAEPAAGPESRDQLKLTAPGTEGSKEAGQASGTSTSKSSGSNDSKALEQVAAGNALADANSRIAALEKNISQMEQMLALKDQKLAQAQQSAKALPASPPTAAPASRQQPALAATPATPAPATERPSAISSAASTVVPWLKSRLSDPVRLAVVVGGLLVISLAGLVLRRRSQQAGANGQRKAARKPVLMSGAVPEGPAAPGEAAVGKAAGTAAARAQGKPDANEVDAIAEADVYIAYGRDEQAEEILRDALRAQPERHALRVKLLEIFAARKDKQAFGALAAELRALTGGKGGAWEQAAQLGQLLDPGNPLYGSGTDKPDLQAAKAAGPAVSANPGPEASPVDDFGLKLEGLLDERRRGQGSEPAPMQSSAATSSPAAPGFSLSGLGRGEAGGQRIEPRLDSELEMAALGTKLELALACQEIGDHEGARELLSEVAAARDPELARRAQAMLRQLA